MQSPYEEHQAAHLKLFRLELTKNCEHRRHNKSVYNNAYFYGDYQKLKTTMLSKFFIN